MKFNCDAPDGNAEYTNSGKLLIDNSLCDLENVHLMHRHFKMDWMNGWMDGWMDGLLGLNGILSTQLAAIS